jgi:cbb3-type cytochrome oxidase maturation protein
VTILYLLIPLAVLLMIGAVWFFIWTVRSGQYEDMEGPAHRILMDDDDPMIPPSARIASKDKASSTPPKAATGTETPGKSSAAQTSAAESKRRS